MFWSLRTVRSVPGLDLETLQENHLERVSHTRSLGTEEEKRCKSTYSLIGHTKLYTNILTYTPFCFFCIERSCMGFSFQMVFLKGL